MCKKRKEYHHFLPYRKPCNTYNMQKSIAKLDFGPFKLLGSDNPILLSRDYALCSLYNKAATMREK